jgi:hypothetical protein
MPCATAVHQDMAVLVKNAFQVPTSAMIAAFKLAHRAKDAKQSQTALLAIDDRR